MSKDHSGNDSPADAMAAPGLSDSPTVSPDDPPPADQLTTFLKSAPESVCPVCDYSLRGLVGEQCPECGKRLKLSLIAAEPYRAPWVVTLLSFGSGAGLGVFSTIILLITLSSGNLRYLTFQPEEIWMLFCAVLYALCIPVLLVTWAQRHRFLKFNQDTQRILASLAVLVVPGSIVGNAIWMLSQIS